MKLRKIAPLLTLVIIMAITMSTPALAFKGSTHAYVTEVGASVLIDTLGQKYSEFYSSDVIDILVEYSKMPDVDEKDGAYMWHFYNPNTGLNFVGGRVSALTKFVSHYEDALLHYKEGQKKAAWESLGRALHYLEDINTPVHTNNQNLVDAGTGLLKHSEFESTCVKVQEKYTVTMTSGSYTYYKNNSLTTIAKASANMANNNFQALTNKTSSSETIAGNAILNAERAVSGILYKFTIDVMS